MAVRRVRGWWQVDFQINSVRYRKNSPLNTRAGAEAFEAQMRRMLSEKGSLDSLLAPKEKTKPSSTFAVFAERWMKSYVAINNKPSEQLAKRKILSAALIPFFGEKQLPDVKAADVEAYKAKEIQRGLSAKTINNRLAILRKCLVTAVEWEELERIPKIQLLKTTPPKFRYISETEIQAIANASATPMERVMVLTAARTGLRFSELRALEWGDIDFGLRLLTVRRCAVGKHVGTPKNGRTRTVPLTEGVIEALKTIQTGANLVFPFAGGMFDHWTALRRLRIACEKCGISPIGWHVLRHTFASQLVTRGASLKAVQDLLGHSTVNMTLRYAHLAPEALRETITLLEPKRTVSSIEMSTGCLRQPMDVTAQVERLLQQAFSSSHG